MNTRALTTATLVGTVLQIAMVSAGHYSPTVAGLFAVGGMGFSLVAGVVYGRLASPTSRGDASLGGLVAGAVCAFVGILVSYLLHDVPASLLALGTLSSAVTGAIGGLLGGIGRRPVVAARLRPVVTGAMQPQSRPSRVTAEPERRSTVTPRPSRSTRTSRSPARAARSVHGTR